MTRNRAAVALCLGALVLLPGCGKSNKGKPIPAATADKLINNVQKADEYSGKGLCARAHTKVRDARFVLTQVPDSVDPDVTQGIGDGLARLDSLITSECQKPQKTNTQTTATDTTQTLTTQTDTTPTETTQSQTTTTQTQTTQTNTVPTSTTPTQTGTGTGTGTTTTTGNGGTPTGTGATGTTGDSG